MRICAAAPKIVQQKTRATDCRRLKGRFGTRSWVGAEVLTKNSVDT